MTLRNIAEAAVKAAAALTLSLSLATSPQALETGADISGATQEGGPGCYDAEVIGAKIISGVCWDCLLPIIIGQLPIAGSMDRMPPGAADNTVLGTCMCYDKLGVPKFGFRTSFWEPTRLVELVRQSGCSEASAFPSAGLRRANSRLLPISPSPGRKAKPTDTTTTTHSRSPT